MVGNRSVAHFQQGWYTGQQLHGIYRLQERSSANRLPRTPFTIYRSMRNHYKSMKKDLHPANYRLVVFQDLNNDTTYLTRSTVSTDETITLDGTEYPLVKVHITSSSHPFFTGEERVLDIEGRVDKFKARAAAAEKAKAARMAAAKKSSQRAASKADKAADEVQQDQ